MMTCDALPEVKAILDKSLSEWPWVLFCVCVAWWLGPLSAPSRVLHPPPPALGDDSTSPTDAGAGTVAARGGRFYTHSSTQPTHPFSPRSSLPLRQLTPCSRPTMPAV